MCCRNRWSWLLGLLAARVGGAGGMDGLSNGSWACGADVCNASSVAGFGITTSCAIVVAALGKHSGSGVRGAVATAG